MTAPPDVAAEFSARFESALADVERRRVEALGHDAGLWLGLAPCWSVPAAEAAGFPAPAGVAAFVDRAAAAGQAERATSLGRDGTDVVTFWATTTARRSLVQGHTDLGAEAHSIAARVAEAAGRAELPGPLRRWAELVATGGGLPDGREILRRVAHAVETGDTVAAAEIVSVGEALEPVVGPTMTSALARARRQQNLGFRRRNDARALGNFLRRDEQMACLRELVLSDGDPWALHLLGMGGVGKTMLIRYLSSGRFADDAGLSPFPVARADFDHISPDYPSRRPVQLLLELADELLLFVDRDVSERAMWQFQSLADSAHAARSGRDADDPEDLVAQAVDAFATVLRQLPQPVVLVLDTCEELAKLHPGAAEVPAVERTFALLEAVHAAAPRMRVLLAGRRYLGRRGAGWEVDVAAEAKALSSMADRPYLGLLELRGFTADEARAYLTVGAERPMPDDLLAAVLERSREVGRVAGALSAGVDGTPRYNPFDLALYRGWFDDRDDPLTLEMLTAGGHDAYVSARIVERLRDPALLAVLPAVALLGRFDEATLSPVCREQGLDVRSVSERLAEQEWIDVGSDAVSGARVLEVEPHLHPRLLSWVLAPDRATALDRAARALREPLGTVLGELPLDRLTTATVAAALGVADAGDRLPRWQVVQDRAVSEAAWDWLVNVARAAEPLAERWDDRVLQATLTAAVAAGLRHQNPRADVAGLWQAVPRLLGEMAPEVRAWRAELARLGPAVPGPGIPDQAASFEAAVRQPAYELTKARGERAGYPAAESLLRRAELGLVAAGATPLPEALDVLRSPAGAPGAFLSALEGLLERYGPEAVQPLGADLRVTLTGREGAGVRWVNPWNGLPMAPAPDGPPRWLSAAGVALARIAGSRDLDTARPLLVEAEEHARVGAGEPALDWPGHADPLLWVLVHRVRYEHVVGADPASLPLEEWEELGLQHLDVIDGERLVSGCLALRLAWGPVAAAHLEELAAADTYQADRLPLWSIHDFVPPLFVTLADGFAALGEHDRAASLLTARLDDARSRRVEDSTVRAAERALLRLRYLRRPTAALARELPPVSTAGVFDEGDRARDLVLGPTSAQVTAATAGSDGAPLGGPPRELGITLLTRALQISGEQPALADVLLHGSALHLGRGDPPLAATLAAGVELEPPAPKGTTSSVQSGEEPVAAPRSWLGLQLVLVVALWLFAVSLFVEGTPLSGLRTVWRVVLFAGALGAGLFLLLRVVPVEALSNRLIRRWVTERWIVPAAVRAVVDPGGASVTLASWVDLDLLRHMGVFGRVAGYAAKGRLTARKVEAVLAVTSSSDAQTPSIYPAPKELKLGPMSDATDALYACPLEVPSELAGADWEGALAAALADEGAWRAVWYRVGPVREPLDPKDWTAGSVRLEGPPEWWDALKRGYGLASKERDPGSASASLSLRRGGQQRVVHALGGPILTASGVRLRLDLPTTGNIESRQRILAVDELGPFDDVGLLVLQGVPYDGRFFDDEREAQGFRRLAVEAAATGARAVLAVPSLPVGVAGDAAHLVHQHWASHPAPPRVDRVLFAAGRLKAAIVGYGRDTDDVEAARQAAQRVLLFVSPWRS